MDTATDTAPASGQVNLPNGGQVTTPQESAAEKTGAMQSWMNTAGGGGGAKPPAPQTESLPAGSQAPTVGEQPQKLQTVGVPVTSLKRGGLLGVMDSMADVLVGKQSPELGKDPDGNMYIKQHNMTHGEQWARIAGEAMRGAAGGLAAGRGVGNMGKAAQAGMQAQEQAAATQKQNMRQDVLDNANNQMLRMNMAEQSMRAKRFDVEANEHDITFWQGQEDRLTKAGATPLGTVAHPGDITGVLKANPDIMKDLVQKHALEFVPVQENGKVAGFKVFKTSEGYRDAMVPAGAQFPTFNSVKGDYDWHKTTEPTTQGQLDDYWTGAGNSGMKFKTDKAEQENKAASTANLQGEKSAREQKLPGDIKHTAAETRQANAAADESAAKATQLKGQDINGIPAQLTTEQPVNGVRANYLAALPSEDRALVQAIGEGRKTDVNSYAMGRSPTAKRLASEVVTAYPGYDFTRAPIYEATRKEFTSGKKADAINALNTAMEHMQQMYDNADWLTTTPLVSNYQRATGDQRAIDLKDAKTALVDELGKAYKGGALTIEDKKSWADRINVWSPSETKGNAVSFIKLMRGKIDSYKQQWEQGSPPGAVAPLEIYSPGAQAAYDHIMGKTTAPAPGGAQQAPPRPQNVPATAHWDGTANNGKGMWLP